MDSPKITYKYYTNPAFCAQSEVVFTQQAPCVSPRVTTSPKGKPETTSRRLPPLGANSPRKLAPKAKAEYNSSNQRVKTDISDNPLRITQCKNDGPLRYVNNNNRSNTPELPPKPGPKPRQANINPGPKNLQRNGSLRRQQAIHVKIQPQDYVRRKMNSSSSHKVEEELEEFTGTEISDSNAEEETEIVERILSARVLKHRYAEIPDGDDYHEYSPSKKRIIETRPEEYNVDAPSEDELEEKPEDVPTEIVKTVNGKMHRYAIIASDEEEEIFRPPPNSPPTFHITSPGMSRKNLEATQKLHQLLATPKKQIRRVPKNYNSPMKSCASSPSLRNNSQIITPNGALSPDYKNNPFPATPRRIASSTPKQLQMTPSKSCANLMASPPLPRRNHSDITSPLSPKAQQKLNYGVPLTDMNSSMRKPAVPDFFVREHSFTRSREPSFIKSRESSFIKSREHSFVKSREPSFNRSHDRSIDLDRSRDLEAGRGSKKQIVGHRSTAIISPRMAMASRGSSSIYSSGTVFSERGFRKRALSPGCATLALAAAMLALCGGLAAALSFYIMCTIGRHYYLDIGVLSGFTCLLLGLLGCRSRTHTLLPNRNYISGYIVLAVFSLLNCGALLALLVWGGTALVGTPADLIQGAVWGLGALCLVLASAGALASCCCSRTPPDNRVQDI